MKLNTKSSITLPPRELSLVRMLQKQLKAKSKVEVVRRGLQLLKQTHDREALKEAFSRAAKAVREVTPKELNELDHLSSEGLSEE